MTSVRSSWADARSSLPDSPSSLPDSKRPRRSSSPGSSPSSITAAANLSSSPSPSSSLSRSLSPVSVWCQPGEPPESERLCWYYAVRHCERLECEWLHCSYREAADRLTDRRLPSLLPWQDDRDYRAMKIWHPRMFRLPSSPAPLSAAAAEEEDDYVAVMTVPITGNAPAAYSRRTFVPAMMQATGLREDGILVMLGTELNLRRLWGSVVFRGLKHRVERAWEAILFLLMGRHGTSSAPPNLLQTMLEHMKLWCEEQDKQRQRDGKDESRHRPARSETETAPQPAPLPAAQPPPPPESLLSSFHDVNYPRLFLQHLDTTLTSFSLVERSLISFTPHLCLAAPLSTSPLSLHVRDPRFIVSFPFPFVYWEWIVGRVGELREAMTALAGVDKQSIAVGSDRGRSASWVLLKAVVTQQQLDLLMEACFLIIHDAQRLARRANAADAPAPLLRRLKDWNEKRRQEFRPEDRLFALQCRGLRCPSLPPPSPPLLPRPESCRPCQGCNSLRGCLDGSCPDSHLSFAHHFALLSSNLPVHAADTPRVTREFAPVLTLLPPSSFSSSPAAQYVLSIPLPRVPWILWVLDKSQSFDDCYPAAAARLARLQRDQHHRVHGDNEGWHTVVAELPTLEAVDELLEFVLFFVEDAHLLQPPDREPELKLRMRLFREERRRWTGDRERQLLSLEMRGLSLRCPPPPLPPPFAAVQAPFSAVYGYGDSSCLPPPPPPSFFSDASSPPSKLAQQTQDSLQADWLSVLSEMKQRGSFVSCPSDVLIPDFSSSDAAFICCRSTFLFACVPIPATEAMRDAVYHQPMAGLPDTAAIEQRYAVQVFMPRLVDDDWKPRNADQLPWLNICVRREGADSSAAEALDAALHCLIARCRRALHEPPQAL